MKKSIFTIAIIAVLAIFANTLNAQGKSTGSDNLAVNLVNNTVSTNYCFNTEKKEAFELKMEVINGVMYYIAPENVKMLVFVVNIGENNQITKKFYDNKISAKEIRKMEKMCSEESVLNFNVLQNTDRYVFADFRPF